MSPVPLVPVEVPPPDALSESERDAVERLRCTDGDDHPLVAMADRMAPRPPPPVEGVYRVTDLPARWRELVEAGGDAMAVVNAAGRMGTLLWCAEQLERALAAGASALEQREAARRIGLSVELFGDPLRAGGER